MKELIFDNAAKGFPFRMDDIDLMQQNTKKLIGQLSRGLGYNSNTCIVNDCQISMNNEGLVNASFNVAAGIIFHNDELYYVDEVLSVPAPYATLAIIKSTYFWDEVIVDSFPRAYKNGDTLNVWRIHKAFLTVAPSTWINISPNNTKLLINLIGDQCVTNVIASTPVKEDMRDYIFGSNVGAHYRKVLVPPTLGQTTSEYANPQFNNYYYQIQMKTLNLWFDVEKITTSDAMDLEVIINKTTADGTYLGDFISSNWNETIPYQLVTGGQYVYQTQPAIIYWYSANVNTITLRIKLFTVNTGIIRIFYNGTCGQIY